MSSGAFTRTKYEFNSNAAPGLTETPVVPIRVQPETVALSIGGGSNSPPAGDINLEVTATVSKGARQNGIGPRKVVLEFTAAPPAGYEGDDLIVPILTQSFFDSFATGATGTYLGADIEVVSKISENLR